MEYLAGLDEHLRRAYKTKNIPSGVGGVTWSIIRGRHAHVTISVNPFTVLGNITVFCIADNIGVLSENKPVISNSSRAAASGKQKRLLATTFSLLRHLLFVEPPHIPRVVEQKARMMAMMQHDDDQPREQHLHHTHHHHSDRKLSPTEESLSINGGGEGRGGEGSDTTMMMTKLRGSITADVAINIGPGMISTSQLIPEEGKSVGEPTISPTGGDDDTPQRLLERDIGPYQEARGGEPWSVEIIDFIRDITNSQIVFEGDGQAHLANLKPIGLAALLNTQCTCVANENRGVYYFNGPLQRAILRAWKESESERESGDEAAARFVRAAEEIRRRITEDHHTLYDEAETQQHHHQHIVEDIVHPCLCELGNLVGFNVAQTRRMHKILDRYSTSRLRLTRKEEDAGGQFTADDTDVSSMTSILICDRLEAKRSKKAKGKKAYSNYKYARKLRREDKIRRAPRNVQLLTRGDPDIVLDKCTEYWDGKEIKPIQDNFKKKLLEICTHWRNEALQIIAFAYTTELTTASILCCKICPFIKALYKTSSRSEPALRHIVELEVEAKDNKGDFTIHRSVNAALNPSISRARGRGAALRKREKKTRQLSAPPLSSSSIPMLRFERDVLGKQILLGLLARGVQPKVEAPSFVELLMKSGIR
eukprot:jgi/Bigna1/67755/fgenesh1_pg.4_\